ncbi:MAG TPA: alpha/beta fold hydrolase [Mycobacteriales bacterium]|nr:alpha/beta fold hydrolase [Mycobacteriales bacterium]
MRARYPDIEDFIERDGIKVGYEVFGAGLPAIVFTPIDGIVESRAWKAQVPYLARNHLVVTIDPRGNGRSDRPTEASSFNNHEFVADTIAVMDAIGIEKAVLVGLCSSGWRSILTAVQHPDRVAGIVSIATWAPFLTQPFDYRAETDFDAELEVYEGWQKSNRHYWLRDWPGYAEFFFGELLSEPHSTKQLEDCIEWAMGIGPETMILHDSAWPGSDSAEQTEAIIRQVDCPVLAIHGLADRCQPLARSERLAELTGGRLVTLEGVGHLPQVREPVIVNHLIRDFVRSIAPPPTSPRLWTRPMTRERRVLMLSSPIGLGHSRRDVAIADELRRLHPDVEVHWLAQHPLTELLERRGEHVHPASAYLASESGHFESESAEHDLHAFQALRRMDEIMVNNFMVFSDLVEDEQYDAWIGDEAWELDYFLHENPDLKRAPYVWLTDFVGWLPMPDGGEREAFLTADYNAEMVEQIQRFPRLRDRALFVGNADDIVPDALGPALPGIREWTEQHFDFVGYVTGYDPADVADTAAVRASLGYRPDELVCIVTVGGSGVGSHLLRRAIAAFPDAKRAVPALRMVVVAGPRIDPSSLPSSPGLEVHSYVHDLYRHLAVCDLAIVQGGLTTAMELTTHRRPFVYVPLRNHFEQNFHVRQRLDRYGAGTCIEYDDATPDRLAAAIADEIGSAPSYRPVETDGAARAAAKIAELL